jgi:hypothetical protein
MRRILFESLLKRPLTEASPGPDDAALAELAANVERAARRRLGRSLSIREVDAGSCNGCELEIHALNNAFYDLERFGLRFVQEAAFDVIGNEGIELGHGNGSPKATDFALAGFRRACVVPVPAALRCLVIFFTPIGPELPSPSRARRKICRTVSAEMGSISRVFLMRWPCCSAASTMRYGRERPVLRAVASTILESPPGFARKATDLRLSLAEPDVAAPSPTCRGGNIDAPCRKQSTAG